MKELRYSAYFKGKGFYSEQQKNYECTYTDDLNEAKKYKTIKGVLERLNYADTTINRTELINEVIIEEFETIKSDESVTLIKTIVGKLDIKQERKRLETERLERYNKKYPLVNEPLKVTIVEIPSDDPYWD
jgi:hypothetical protein